MKIDLTKHRMHHWFEDEDGNVYDAMSYDLPNKDWFSYHVINTCVYSEDVDSYTCHPEYLHENNLFYKALLCFKPFYRWMQKRHRKEKTFKRICSGQVHYGNEDCIVAMVNSGDYTLSEAIFVYCNACERCANVLAYKYLNGEHGYEEYSDEWKKCNTVCDWCRGGE